MNERLFQRGKPFAERDRYEDAEKEWERTAEEPEGGGTEGVREGVGPFPSCDVRGGAAGSVLLVVLLLYFEPLHSE